MSEQTAVPSGIADHRDFVAALDMDQRVALNRRRDGPALRKLAVHVAIIAGFALAIGLHVPFWPLLMLPLGILLIFLFTLQHEAAHDTLFRTPALNRWVLRICGVITVVPPLWFRFFHLAHHRHTQDPDNDPELEGGKPETITQYAWHITGIPMWVTMVRVLLRNALGRVEYEYVPQGARRRVVVEARVQLAMYALAGAASLAAQSTLLLYIWVIPAMLGQPLLRLYLLAEHGRCPLVANMLENTRTTYTNRLVRWLAWNMPYHAEHHAVPTVPYHQLPALHELAKPHLRTTADGYVAFNRDYAAQL